jgi:tRNA-2-methylthio-N6-dimethylallyladenosine synthase
VKYFVKIFGCQYNEWDGARINFLLQKIGLQEVSEQEAEIVFVIACAVRQTAVDRIFGKVKLWQDKKVVLTGCILEADKKRFAAKNVALWDGKDLVALQNLLNLSDSTAFQNLALSDNATSPYLPIMVGCNNFCTYCAVPYTRGRETSRPMDDIIKDFELLVKKGEKEITLLGQNVNSYQYGFADLLKNLNAIPGDFTIYFTSNHPKDMTDEVIETIATLPKVAKQIHLPVQSGSDQILRAMNRPYTKKQYLDLVQKLKTKIPQVKITTDVIVGFPGETEEDFQQTVEIFKQVNYHIAYVNKYSPRAGTVAYKLGDPIPWQEKQRRWRILDQIANK